MSGLDLMIEITKVLESPSDDALCKLIKLIEWKIQEIENEKV